MIEDRLTHAERIRLESLSQALNTMHVAPLHPEDPSVTRIGPPTRITMAEVFARAEEIEAWLRSADSPRKAPKTTIHGRPIECDDGPWA